ncbi:MAG: (deoxy)nucleoside triphosphate pyrophosphohydrolase [Moraxella sp.]
MQNFNVVAAIIYHESKFLCAQRSESKHNYLSKKFEFPGGKVEEGESLTQALKREIHEELNLNIRILSKYDSLNYSYPDFSVFITFFLCEIESLDNLIMNEHQKLFWLPKEQIIDLDWAAADLPIVRKITEDKGFMCSN